MQLKERRAMVRGATPATVMRRGKAVRDMVSRLRLRGDAVQCPICDHTWAAFARSKGRGNARCPGCGALERHRLMWLYLARCTDLLSRAQQVLHVAPEDFLRPVLAATHGSGYVYGDLADPAHRLDITDLEHADETFDVVICSHVFEHVPDDGAAVAELFRVLRPGGYAILDAPVDGRRAVTDEDPSVTSARARRRRFGQWDHVRVYGRDYPDLLREGGFDLDIDPEFVEAEDRRRYGLRTQDHIYLCHKRT